MCFASIMVKGTRLAVLPRLLFPRIHLSESVIFRDSDNGCYITTMILTNHSHHIIINNHEISAGLTRGEVECTADLLELVGEEVMECVRKQQEIGGEVGQVFQGLDMYREEGVCIMIHRIVHKCGNMWRNCYTDSEVSGWSEAVHQFIHLR